VIAALILAAGNSKRMGSPKMSLPWGDTTVLGQVLEVFKAAAVGYVLVVTGGAREGVEKIASAAGAQTVFNPDFAKKEMLSSLQAGLQALPADANAALIALGDQPQIQLDTVTAIATAYSQTRAALIVPSYHMRRGHPWLIARELWGQILSMQPPQTPRDFLNERAAEIQYVELDTASVLQDLDTPEDYMQSHN
jgi:molybdenum cofactor cytidylyltransferase